MLVADVALYAEKTFSFLFFFLLTSHPQNKLPSKPNFSFKDTHRLKVQGWKKVFHSNRSKERAGKAVITSDKQTLSQKWQQETKNVIT